MRRGARYRVGVPREAVLGCRRVDEEMILARAALDHVPPLESSGKRQVDGVVTGAAIDPVLSETRVNGVVASARSRTRRSIDTAVLRMSSLPAPVLTSSRSTLLISEPLTGCTVELAWLSQAISVCRIAPVSVQRVRAAGAVVRAVTQDHQQIVRVGEPQRLNCSMPVNITPELSLHVSTCNCGWLSISLMYASEPEWASATCVAEPV